MLIYHAYALVVGVVLAVAVCVGVVCGSKRLILFSMIFGAIVASPVTSFTRGAAGAIYPSDLVGAALLFCLVTGGARSLFSRVVPTWYRFFLALMLVCTVSVVFVAPFVTPDLSETGIGGNVRSPVRWLPLPVAMAGLRLVRIMLYVVYFSYAARLAVDAKVVGSVSKAAILAITGLAVCQILTFFGVADLQLYLPRKGYEYMHIVGHPKAAAGRLFMVGVFLCVMRLRRTASAPVYLAALAAIVVAGYACGSRAALVGTGVGILVFAALANVGGKFFATLFILAAVSAVPWLASIDVERSEQFAEILVSPAENPRWVIWDWTVRYLFSHPPVFLTGVGFSNFYYGLYSEWTIAEHGHNDLLTCLTELGVLGLILFACYLLFLGRDILRSIRVSTGRGRWEALCLGAILGGFLATGFFEASMYYSVGAMPMQRIVAILFGVFTARWQQQWHEDRAWPYDARIEPAEPADAT
ncbi:MAG: O-antigen ligase family protein [Phycisphaerae bacterium]